MKQPKKESTKIKTHAPKKEHVLIPLGSSVTVITSVHADIATGAKGIVKQHKEDGYGVEIKALFSRANDVSHKHLEKRIVFMAKTEIYKN